MFRVINSKYLNCQYINPAKSDMNGEKRKFNYCVLYTQTLKQYDVYQVIRKSMPEGRGTVFYPCAELWWNNTVDTVIRPLFPGYGEAIPCIKGTVTQKDF